MFDFLTDSHCHLNMLEKEGRDLNEVVENAKRNNVKYLTTICTTISEADDLVLITDKYSNIYSTVGIHPSEASKERTSLDILLTYGQKPKVVGFGETGLDYYYEPFDKIDQQKNFELHIEASRKSNLPVIIHSRSADRDMCDILKSEMKNGEFKFILHCFSSERELAYAGVDLGGYISLSGIITFKKAEELRSIIKEIPFSSCLIETDAPYLAPMPYRGKMNEPAFVKNTAEYVAEFLNIPMEEVINTTTSNYFKVFDKIDCSFDS